LHIGLNLIYLVPGESGGTETYARELIRALLQAAPAVTFTSFVNAEAAAHEGPWQATRMVRLPVHGRSRAQWVLGEQVVLPGAAGRADVDLLHSLANTGPLHGAFVRVVTVHDLHFKVVPEAHLGLRAGGMRVLVPLAARRSQRIIVPATSTQRDLQQLIGVPSAKIDVVPEGHGVGARTIPVSETKLRDWLGASKRPIVLSVSALRPHKNLIRLISAVAAISPERRPLLVVPGYRTEHERDLRAHAERLGLADDVRLLGWITEERLEGLYAAATCLVCASLHEGFGLPVLEAMARGVPVACSDRGALAEVAGSAALMFDPTSVESISAAIETLLGDPEERERLRRAGRERCKQYTWARAAAETIESYRRALDHRRPDSCSGA
jgi:glycosyltransferase involved in cell wall biosynthesis